MSETTARVLVVEDDSVIVRTLRINLRARGYDVLVAQDGTTALQLAHTDSPDVVLLDLGLPDLDGVEVLRRLRKTSSVPVIVLSARRESDDKVEALDEGADDYVTKPFGMDELLARIRVALRRTVPGGHSPEETSPEPVVTADFGLDFGAFRATRHGQEVHLTPTEWRLLAELARHRGTVVPGRQLLQAVWGPAYGRESNYLRVYANQLRRKLEPDPSQPRYILTEPGIGYRLEA